MEGLSQPVGPNVSILNTYFDAVLVHTDPSVITLGATFPRINEISIPIYNTGYISPKPRITNPQTVRNSLSIADGTPFILGSIGSGIGGIVLGIHRGIHLSCGHEKAARKAAVGKSFEGVSGDEVHARLVLERMGHHAHFEELYVGEVTALGCPVIGAGPVAEAEAAHGSLAQQLRGAAFGMVGELHSGSPSAAFASARASRSSRSK